MTSSSKPDPPASYIPYFSEPCKKCFGRHPTFREGIADLVHKICIDPYKNSHLLKKKKGIDLRGKRRRHLTGNFVGVFMICEECMEKGFREKGWNACHFCEEIPPNSVVFLAFDKWDNIYKREWDSSIRSI